MFAFDKDPRKVVADTDALYFGWLKLDCRTLLPRTGAHPGSTKLEWWLAHAPPPPSRSSRQRNGLFMLASPLR